MLDLFVDLVVARMRDGDAVPAGLLNILAVVRILVVVGGWVRGWDFDSFLSTWYDRSLLFFLALGI